MGTLLRLDLNVALRRIQSAHSFAIALGQFVAKLNLELTLVQTPFAVSLRDVEFFAFLANLVGNLVGGERRRGKDELKLVDFFQLCFERFKRVYRKTGGRDLQACTGFECLLEVVAEQAVDVVDQFHQESAFVVAL